MTSMRRIMDFSFIALLLLVVAYLSGGPYVVGYLRAKANGGPVNAQDAADMVISRLYEKQRATLAATPRDQLIQYHFGLGLTIRNDFSLWSGNEPLLYSVCGDSNYCDPDEASFAIIERTWEKLHAVTGSKTEHQK